MPSALLVAATLWLPLLALDIGYPDLLTVLQSSTLLKSALISTVIAFAVVLAAGLPAGLVACRMTGRTSTTGPIVAFFGMVLGSGFLVSSVGFIGKLPSPPFGDLAIALVAAAVVGATLAMVGGLSGGSTRRDTALFVVGALSALGWAYGSTQLIRSTDSINTSLSTYVIALGATLVASRALLARVHPSAGRIVTGVGVLLALAGATPAIQMGLPHEDHGGPTQEPFPAAGAPNVLVLMIDTWRFDDTDLTAEHLGTTPRLSVLAAARRTTVFTAANSAAPGTAPSVKALITSRLPSHFGIQEWGGRPPRNAWTMARAFRRSGYETVGFSSNALVSKDGFQAGFDRYWAAGGFDKARRSFFLYAMLAQGDWWRALALMDQLAIHKVRGDVVVDRFSDWLNDRDDRPFFAYLHIIEPHWPYYDRNHGFVPDELKDLAKPYSHVDLMRLPKRNPKNAKYRDTDEMREMIGRYRDEVRDADRVLGRVLDELESRGLSKRTLLVVVGDHGEEFMEHDGFGHGHNLFEEQIHIPLVVHWPTGEEFASMPARVDIPVSLLDVFPTLQDLLQLTESPHPMVGRSLRGVLAGQIEPAPVISEMVSRSRQALHVRMSYRLGAYKAHFVFLADEKPSSGSSTVVFNLEDDPGERRALDGKADVTRKLLEQARQDLDVLWLKAKEASKREQPAEPQTDDKELERLRSLGYLG